MASAGQAGAWRQPAGLARAFGLDGLLGLLTRFGALTLVIDLAVAFIMVHKMAVGMAPHSGELAFIYLAGFAAILLAGPGKFSMDKALFGKGASGK